MQGRGTAKEWAVKGCGPSTYKVCWRMGSNGQEPQHSAPAPARGIPHSAVLTACQWPRTTRRAPAAPWLAPPRTARCAAPPAPRPPGPSSRLRSSRNTVPTKGGRGGQGTELSDLGRCKMTLGAQSHPAGALTPDSVYMQSLSACSLSRVLAQAQAVYPRPAAVRVLEWPCSPCSHL